MTEPQHWTIAMLIAVAVFLLAWNLTVLVIVGPEATISHVLHDLVAKYPWMGFLIGFALGFIFGHALFPLK